MATVIELPDGRAILYDAGTTSPYDVGRSSIVPFLRHRGVGPIDRVYVSHPNLDHFSGLLAVLDDVPTGPIVVNEHFEPKTSRTSPSRYLLRLLRERGHEVRTVGPAVQTWELGGVTFERLWPPENYDDSLSSNDSSTVLRLSYAGRSILLAGDIEDRPQRALLHAGNLRADVLVLPHHGSVRPSTKEFLDAVGAGVLIRSSGQRMADTFNGLQEAAGVTQIYNTADVGAVEVVIDQSGVRVSTIRDGAS